MAIRDIITAPDPRLKQVSAPVARVDDGARRLMDDMLETMYEAPGIGLAAIQVGVAKRIIVMDLAKEGEEKKPLHFVNPELLWVSEETKPAEEGCLSLPDMFDIVERPAQARVKFLDYGGEAREILADGLLAVCLQHEMDHLEGILFVDHLSRLKRDMILRKLVKAKRLALAD
ncbi:MAG: peptide deformylase [Alphaproteobacteria bacterium]